MCHNMGELHVRKMRDKSEALLHAAVCLGVCRGHRLSGRMLLTVAVNTVVVVVAC